MSHWVHRLVLLAMWEGQFIAIARNGVYFRRD